MFVFASCWAAVEEAQLGRHIQRLRGCDRWTVPGGVYRRPARCLPLLPGCRPCENYNRSTHLRSNEGCCWRRAGHTARVSDRCKYQYLMTLGVSWLRWFHEFPVNNTSHCTWNFETAMLIRGAFEKFVDWQLTTRCPYFVTFQHSLMQLQCMWSSISPKLWFHCRRIVVLGLAASHLSCR